MTLTPERAAARHRERMQCDPDYVARRRVAGRRAAQKRYDERRAVIWAAKRVPCMDCGWEGHPAAMDFDHRDPSEKSFHIGRDGTRQKEALLLAEIAKCDVVCARCHRLRHVDLNT